MTKETVALYLENGFKGRRNVISSRELERVLGISGNELRRRVNRLRQDTVALQWRLWYVVLLQGGGERSRKKKISTETLL